MKKIILFTMILMCGMLQTRAETTTDTTQNDGKYTKKVTVSMNKNNMSIVAVSDTTDKELSDTLCNEHNVGFDPVPNIFGDFDFGKHFGFSEVLIAIISIIGIFFMPFIFIAFVIWLIIRHRSNRQRERNELIRTLAANGQNVETYMKESLPISPEKKEKGIKNMCLGVGLALFLYILLDKSLSAVGILVFFVGLGQFLSASYSKRHNVSPIDEAEQDKASVKEEAEQKQEE